MRVLFFVVVIFYLSSCNDGRIFERNTDLDNKIWRADSVVDFEFIIADITKSYRLYFNVRNTVSYPYENIYVTYALKDTASNEIKKELINYDLFDPKTGEPYGSGLGDVFDHQFLILEDYKFERPGPYIFEIQQYMRMDSLPEILSTGVRVEQIEVEQ